MLSSEVDFAISDIKIHKITHSVGGVKGKQTRLNKQNVCFAFSLENKQNKILGMISC